ncbi:MAG: glycosyltransferase [Acidobacteria bacterium]|nr:glycosyltransferase [Acidobacteriota bacterium]
MISIIGMVLVAFSMILFMGYSIFIIANRRRSIRYDALPPERLHRVSILKPVKNPAPGFAENLESFFRLDYPDYEILFGVESPTEPALAAITRLMTKYPDIPVVIVLTGHQKPANPKVDNLMKMERLATGEHYWVADADVHVERDTLKRLMHEYILHDSKLIFSPIRGAGAETLGSLADNTHFSYFVSGNVIAGWQLFRQQITVGKSMFLERRTLEEKFGGFAYFLDFLAEDYVMGETYVKAGLPVSTNCTWVTATNRRGTLTAFYSRMARWSVLRFNLKKIYYFSEILFLNPLVMSLLLLVPFSPHGGWWMLGVFGTKLSLEFINFLILQPADRVRSRTWLLFPLAVLLKDILIFAAYLTPLFTDKVNWRGRQIVVGKMTRIGAETAIPLQEQLN